MRYNFVSWLLAIGLLLFCTKAIGQKVLFPEINPASARFDNFLLENGNAEPATTCVFQDKKGFIWCGTELGLYRFDGINYLKFGIGRSDSTLLGYMVLSIFEDSEGTIWAGTHRSLNRIDLKTGRVKHFMPDSTDGGSPANAVRLIKEDRNGLFWLITDRDIYTFNREKEEFNKYSIDSAGWRSGHPPVVYENDRFLEDKSGRIWIATDNGLYLFRHEFQKWHMVYPEDSSRGKGIQCKVNCIAEDSESNILFGTELAGILQYSEDSSGESEITTFFNFTDRSGRNEQVSAIFPETPENLWVFGNSTLIHYNPLTRESRSYLFSDESRLSRKWEKKLQIDKIFRGKDNKLWLINLGNGFVFQFDQLTENLKFFGVPRYVEFSFIQDITGNLWFASVAQNMFRLITDSLPFMISTVPNSRNIQAGNMTRITEDKHGNLWLALPGGVFKILNPDLNPELKPEKLQMSSNNSEPVSIYYDRNNIFWIGFNKGFVVKYDPENNRFLKYDLPAVPPLEYSPVISIIREDKSGNIWFATQYHGIFRLSEDGNRVIPVISFEDLVPTKSNMYLLDFQTGENGELWISTDDDLFRTSPDGNRVTNLSGFADTEKGYGNFNVRILCDKNNKILILNTFSGVYIFNEETNDFIRPNNVRIQPMLGFGDLLLDKYERFWFAEYGRISFVDPGSGKTRIFNIAERDGDIQSFLTDSGRIVYIFNNKLMIFPKDIPVNRFIPPVYITAISVNNNPYNHVFPDSGNVTDLKKVDLKFNQNNLKFEFAALNYTHPEHNMYRYFMDGIDIDTVRTGPGSAAEYKQMAPGRYKFWVTGSNNDGIWNQSGVSLEILINPPWFKSVLAYIIYLLVTVLLITGYIRFRIYSLEEDNKRLEDEVKIRTKELELSNRQLEEIDRIKTHFFTDISHEIRTPLSLIIGPLETISKEVTLNERLFELVAIMKRNSQRLMQLVDQLLDISRLDAGKMKINLREDDILKCLRILVYEFLSFAESKQIKYIVELPEKEFITWFDRDKIEKIISNLLTNAFKFTPDNGMINCLIKIDQGETDKNHHILLIKVVDSGTGIENANLDRIFDRFFRVEGRDETVSHGSGIGLSLTRELTSLLHGDIKVTSIPGAGSEFLVSLPLGKEHLSSDEYLILKDPQKKAAVSGILSYPLITTPDKKRKLTEGMKKVLVIEDNEDLRSFIMDSLSDQYQVLGAENGRTGINIAFTMMPDIIITDIMMPDIDGIRLCSELKNDERTSHIPIIILTAKATTDDKIEGLKSGADDYVIKPFNMDELKTRITNLLSIREKLTYRFTGKSETLSEKTESVDDRFMEKVISIINKNISNFDFDVRILHEHLGMSRMHLSRKLKILTGLSPHIFIRNIRLEKAAELLFHNTGNTTEIANSVGISNTSGFSKAFRDYFGVSPKKYLNQSRQPNNRL